MFDYSSPIRPSQPLHTDEKGHAPGAKQEPVQPSAPRKRPTNESMEWQAVPIGDRIASSLALAPVPYHLTLRLFELEKGPRDAITKEMSAWIDAHAPELRKAPDASQARHAARRLVTEHSLRYSDHPDKLVSSLLLALRDPQSPGRLPPANFEGFLQTLIPELEVALITWDTFDSICKGVSEGLKGVANLADLARTFIATSGKAQEEASSRPSYLTEFIECMQKRPLLATPVPSSSVSVPAVDDESVKLVLKRRREDDENASNSATHKKPHALVPLDPVADDDGGSDDDQAILQFDWGAACDLDQESLGAYLLNEQHRMPSLEGLTELVGEWLKNEPPTQETIAQALCSMTIVRLRPGGWIPLVYAIAHAWGGAKMADHRLNACIKGILQAVDTGAVSKECGLNLGKALRASIGRDPKAPGLVAHYAPKTAGFKVFMGQFKALLKE